MLYQQAKNLKKGMRVCLIESGEIIGVDRIKISEKPPLVMIYGKEQTTGRLNSFDHRKAGKVNPLEGIRSSEEE